MRAPRLLALASLGLHVLLASGCDKFDPPPPAPPIAFPTFGDASANVDASDADAGSDDDAGTEADR